MLTPYSLLVKVLGKAMIAMGEDEKIVKSASKDVGVDLEKDKSSIAEDAKKSKDLFESISDKMEFK